MKKKLKRVEKLRPDRPGKILAPEKTNMFFFTGNSGPEPDVGRKAGTRCRPVTIALANLKVFIIVSIIVSIIVYLYYSLYYSLYYLARAIKNCLAGASKNY